MPNKTFYNLNTDKQNKLINAAINEFSKVLFNEASINQIIKEADISRGSFYMYFNDKEDLYLYIIDHSRTKSMEELNKILDKNKGDIFKSLEDIFTYTLEDINSKSFLKNMMLNMQFKDDFANLKCPHNKEELNIIMKKIDRTKLKNINDIEFDDLMHIIFGITIHNIIKVIKCDTNITEQKERYINQLKIIKNGIYKEEYHD